MTLSALRALLIALPLSIAGLGCDPAPDDDGDSGAGTDSGDDDDDDGDDDDDDDDGDDDDDDDDGDDDDDDDDDATSDEVWDCGCDVECDGDVLLYDELVCADAESIELAVDLAVEGCAADLNDDCAEFECFCECEAVGEACE